MYHDLTTLIELNPVTHLAKFQRDCYTPLNIFSLVECLAAFPSLNVFSFEYLQESYRGGREPQGVAPQIRFLARPRHQ